MWPVLALWAATRAVLLAGLSLLSDAGDGVMALTFEWAQQILAGDSPYHARGVAYPPLPMFFFASIGIGEQTATGYAARFAAVVLMADLLGLIIISRDRTRGRSAALAYVLGVFSAGPILLLWRYDLIPALFHLAAALCLLRGLRRLSWACLGVGIAFKPYLAFLAPLWFVWELRQPAASLRRRLGEAAAWTLLPSAAAAVGVLPLAGFDFVAAYTFQGSRGLQVESSPAILLAESAGWGGTTQRPVFSQACLCWERAGPAAGTAALVSSTLAAAGLAAAAWVLWRRPGPWNTVKASCAAILILLLTYRVFSPQYLLWALVPLALLAASRPGALAACCLGAAGIASSVLYPGRYGEVVQYTGPGRWLLLARILLLTAALCLCILPKPSKSVRE